MNVLAFLMGVMAGGATLMFLGAAIYGFAIIPLWLGKRLGDWIVKGRQEE
jgi:hypothetical protein